MNALTPSPEAANRRALERTPTALRGKVFPGVVDCRLEDFHRDGARLSFPEATAAGDEIVVVIWSSGFAFDAVVRWRRGEEIGVQFQRRFDLNRSVPPHLAEVKAKWRKRRRRFRRTQLVSCPAFIRARPAPRQASGVWRIAPPDS